MSKVEVLCPNGRRVIVKVAPNTKLLKVILDVPLYSVYYRAANLQLQLVWSSLTTDSVRRLYVHSSKIARSHLDYCNNALCSISDELLQKPSLLKILCMYVCMYVI